MPLYGLSDNGSLDTFKSSSEAMSEDVRPREKRIRWGLADNPFEQAESAAPVPQPKESGDFGRGLGTSWEQAKQMVGGTIAYAGDVIGADSVRQYGLDIYKNAQAKVQAQAKESDEFTNVLEGKGSLVDWLQYTAGYISGQVLEAGAAMVAGAAVGSAALPGGGTIGGAIAGAAGKTAVKAGLKDLTEKLLEKEVDRQLKKGLTEEAARAAAAKTVAATAGAATANGLNNFVQEAGAIYGEANQEAEKEGRRLSGMELARVGGSAGVAAALDTVIDQAVVGRVFRPQPGGRLMSNVVKEGLVLGATNSITEGLQTSIERFGAGQNLADAEAIKDYINSMAVGALGGTAAGVASGTARTFAKKDDDVPFKYDELDDEQTTKLTPEQFSKYAAALGANGIDDSADPRAAKLVRFLEEREANQQSEERPTIIAGETAGDAFVATPGNLAGRAEAEARTANASLPPEQREMTDVQATGLERATTGSALTQNGLTVREAEDSLRQVSGPEYVDALTNLGRDVANTRQTGTAQSQQAFDVANAQSERATPDVNRQDVSAGGTTTPAGAEAVEVKPVTFFGAVIKGGQMTSGTRVEIVEGGLKVKDANGIQRNASKIAFEDGRVEVVPDSALTSFGRANQPRFAQDVNERSYSPPTGVGVKSNPAPRFSAQRASVGQTGQTTEQTTQTSPGQLPDIDPSLPKPKAGEKYVRLYGPNITPGTVAVLSKKGAKAKAPGQTIFLGEKSQFTVMPYVAPKASTTSVATTSPAAAIPTTPAVATSQNAPSQPVPPATPAQNASQTDSGRVSAEVTPAVGTTPPAAPQPPVGDIKNTPAKKAAKPAKSKKIPIPNEYTDSMFVAIAKLGGIRKDDLIGWGVDPRMIGKIPLWRVGYPLARAKGGHSVDGMGELLLQYGYLTPDQNGKHDLAEFEELFQKELSGTPHYTAAGQQQLDEQQQDEAAKDYWDNADDIDLTQQDMEESGYDDLSLEEQAQVEAIVQNAVEVLGEAEVDAIKQRLSMQYPSDTDYQKALKDELQARIEAVANARDGEEAGRDAQRQTGTDTDGGVEADRRTSGQQGQESFQLDQPTPAELARREMDRKNQERQNNAPPSDDFALTGSSRQTDEAAARGQMELDEAAEVKSLRNQLLAAYKKGDLSKDSYDAAIESIDEGDLDYPRALLDPEDGLKARLPRGVSVDDAVAFKRAVQRRTKKTWNFQPLNDEQAARQVKGYSIIKFLGDRLGVKVVFVNNLDPKTYDFEGAFVRSRKNVVFINTNVTTPHLTVFGHEFLHVLRTNNESLYQDVKELLLDLTHAGKLPAKYRERMVDAGYKNDNEVLTEEFVADVFGDMMTDRKFWDVAMETNPGLIARIAEKLTQFINEVLGRFPGYETSRYFRDLKAAREVVAEALSDYMQAGNPDQRAKRTGDLAESLRRTVMAEPNFREWFGKSQIKDGEGPKVMYHTTARDIKAFTPKQAGAIFVSPNADFTLRFGKDSENWMVRHADQFFTPQQIEKFKKDALSQLRRNNPRMPKAEFDYFKNSLLDTREYVDLVTANLPTRSNTIPLFVRSENAFDYEDKAQVDSVVKQIMNGQRTATFEGDINGTLEADEVASRLSVGGWTFIENPKVQQAIRSAGFDGFYAREHGVKNLAVYSPNQLKSAIANNGGYSLDTDEIAESAVRIRQGKENLKRYGVTPGSKAGTREIAAALQARQRAKYGVIDRDDRSQTAIRRIARWMADEVEFAYQPENRDTSGAGWYGIKYQRALNEFAELFPQLRDSNQRSLFTMLVAITSDGQKVYSNFNLAKQLYEGYVETGKIPAEFTFGGDRNASMVANAAQLNSLLTEFNGDIDAMSKYLLQEARVGDLAKMAKEQGRDFRTAYQVSVKLPLSALIFGPKLGAFYANLMGSHGYLTMDRWWSRTFNRYRGTLLKNVNGTADSPTNARGEKLGLARFKELAGQPDISDEEALSLSAVYRKQYEDKGFKEGTAVEKAANTVYKDAFINLNDTPFNATDRTFMVESVRAAKAVLATRGLDLTVADIQAVLWYFEKRLYGELGARKTADVSYEEVARRVVGESRNQSGRPASQRPGADESIGSPETDSDFVPPDEDADFPGGDDEVAESRRRDTNTENFRSWFGDSKVVDKEGNPLVVYHGTNSDFTTFDARKAGDSTGHRTAHWGFFFSAKPEIATKFAGKDYVVDPDQPKWTPPPPQGLDKIRVAFGMQRKNMPRRPPAKYKEVSGPGANLMPVYLSIENPRTITADEFVKRFVSGDESARQFLEETKEMNHDGIVIRGDTRPGWDTSEYGADAWVAFYSPQIKSATGNNGNFSVDSDDIMESKKRLYVGLSKDAQSGLGKIDPEPKSIIEKMKGLFQSDRIKQGVFDQFRQIGTYDKNAYMLARLSRAWDGGLEALISHGKIGFDKDGAVVSKGGKGLIETFKPLEGEVDRFLAWVAANRAEKLSREERERLFTPAEMKAMKSELNRGNLKSGQPRAVVYGNALRDMNELNKSVLDMARQSGLIDDDAYSRFSSDIFYVPFYRMMEDGETSSVQSASGLVNQSFSKKLKGGEQALANLTDNILQNWGMLISASLKNQAAGVTLDAATKNGAARELKVGESVAGQPFVMRDGNKVHYEVTDDLLLDSISAISFSGNKDWLSLLAAPVKRLYTRGVTASPLYKIRNLIRDTMSAPALVKDGYNPLENAVQRLFADTDANILAGGGIFSMGLAFEGNSKQLMSRLEAMGVSADTILDTPDKIMAVLRQAAKKYDDLGNRLENVNRVGIYQQLRAKGYSHLEASFAARDLQDFSSMGSFAAVRYFTNIVPFLGARIQGLYKLGRAAQENPQRFWTVAGGVMLASVALQAAYKDDDDWKEREEWDRDTYWWFKVGDVAYRIPKPFEIGSLGTLAERVLEQINDDSVEGKVLAERIWAIGTQTFAFNPVPQVVKPMLDIYANRDPFSDRPIETIGMERLPKEMRATAGTSYVAKGAANMLGSVADLLGPIGKNMKLSPVQIDYLVKGYFGFLGTTAAAIADMPMNVISDNERPDSKLGSWTGKMIETVPTTSSKYVTMFYKSAEETAETYAAVKELRRLGKDGEADELIEEKRAKIRMHKVYNTAKEKLADINQRVRQINEDAGMTGAEKRSEIDRLSRVRAELAKRIEESRISASD